MGCLQALAKIQICVAGIGNFGDFLPEHRSAEHATGVVHVATTWLVDEEVKPILAPHFPPRHLLLQALHSIIIGCFVFVFMLDVFGDYMAFLLNT